MKRTNVDVCEALLGFLQSLRETPSLDDGETTLVVLRFPEEAADNETAKVEAEGQLP